MRSVQHAVAILRLLVLIPVLGGSAIQSAAAAFPGQNGLIAFASNRDGNFEIYVMNPDGSGQTNITNNPASDNYPAWSPDGSKIAFSSDRDGNFDIYVMNADGSDVRRVADRPTATDAFPAWSSDGSKIVFASFNCCPEGANYDIWVMNADGSGQTNITNDPAEDILPSWQPGGSTVAFQTNRDGNAEIYTMNADGTGLMNVSSNAASDDGDPHWSPDASAIVFASNRETVGFGVDIYVMNANGSGVTRLTNTQSDSMPAWSPDGLKLASRSSRDFNDEIYMMNADGSGGTRLTSNALPGNTLPEDWFPDWQPIVAGDTTPPTITCTASPSTLWPPNHKLLAVSVAVSASVDSGSATVTLVSVTSNQPDSGSNPEDAPEDVQGWTVGSDDQYGLLRAERFEQSRTYVLTYQAQDSAGNTAVCEANVVVPKSQRP